MTPIDIIKRAFNVIGVLGQGEAPGPDETTTAFDMLNDMLDMWANQHLMVYYQNEVFHEIVPAQYIYTIGSTGQVGCSFTGSIAGNVLTITNISAGAVNVGQYLNTAGGVSAGTQITGPVTGQQGMAPTGLGTYNVNISQTVVSGPLTSYAVRPLRINSAFVRVAGIDYPVKILSFEDYEKIGLKSLNGPWPYGLYYQPTEPNGTIIYWPNPSSGEVHMFCDNILTQFQTTSDVITIPQGYVMAMRWNLAELLMPAYGMMEQTQVAMVTKHAAQSLAWLKRINQRPQQEQQFPTILTTGRNWNDAGFIMNGGFL